MQEALLRYVQPQGELPEVKGSGTLLVIGSAACVWDDLQRYDHLHQGDRMAVNDMIAYYPEDYLQWGVTLHPDKLTAWRLLRDFRTRKRHKPSVKIHSARSTSLVDYVWPLHNNGGTSGIFGAIIGLLMGYERIILVGIPCDDSPRFFDPPWKNHILFGAENVLKEWPELIKGVPEAKERITSLSGRTREIFGEPV